MARLETTSAMFPFIPKENPMKPLAAVFACLLFASSAAFAQGVGSSGEIRGTVTDPSGAVLPNTNVTVVSAQTAFQRVVTTDATGQFRVTGLSPALYDVTVTRPGFATELRKGLPISIGQIVLADFQLKISQSTTLIEVMWEAPLVEAERASQANTISQDNITDLPIDRRDYLTFTLLAPGVSDSSRLAGDQDFRVKQTPQSGLSFYGSNGRGNSITVDGGETSGDSGGVRLTVSQDAVQEFQINRSNYAPDLGSATGASINIVTKSGTNGLHGTVYGFFRDDAMDARNPFSFAQSLRPGQTFDPTAPDSLGSPVKDSLSRQQFGGTVGFPIQKDKTFLFAAFEGLRQDSQNAVPLLTNTNILRPTAAQNTLIAALAAEGPTVVQCLNSPNGIVPLPANICAGALIGGLTTSQLTGLNPGQTARNTFLVNQFETQGGLFNYSSRQYLTSGRLEHHFSGNDTVSLTYRYGHDVEQSPDVQSLTAFSAGSSIHTYDS